MNPARTAAVGCIAALFASALPAQSAWKDLIDQSAPAIHADDWLNVAAGQSSPADLEGKVWLLYFFATT